MNCLSDQTREIMANVHRADAAIAQGDLAAARRIYDALATGDRMEQFASEIVAAAISKAAPERRPTVDDLRRLHEANGNGKARKGATAD